MQRKYTCQICGAEYVACSDCDKAHNWKSVVCTQKCWQIYKAVTEHRLKIINAAQAASALNAAGITKANVKASGLKPEVINTCGEIFDKGSVKSKKEEVVETSDTKVVDVKIKNLNI